MCFEDHEITSYGFAIWCWRVIAGAEGVGNILWDPELLPCDVSVGEGGIDRTTILAGRDVHGVSGFARGVALRIETIVLLEDHFSSHTDSLSETIENRPAALQQEE